ncbi:MAG TPA: hypothetical protein VGI93_04465 [Steroidobacteraceae bacterium]
MIEALVVAGVYLTLYANKGGAVVQVAALLVLLCAAIYAVLTRRMKPIATSVTEIVMYVAGSVSIIQSMFNDDLMASSIAFVLGLISMSVICRSLPLGRLLDLGAAIAFLNVITTLAIERSNVVRSLSVSVGANGLERFTPLENHPDLSGFIFGSGAILLLRCALLTDRRAVRIGCISAALASWLFILAASARSSLIATGVAAFVALLFELRHHKILSLKWLSVEFLIGAIAGAFLWEKIAKYLTAMLELDSGTRGVGSGGSGRFGYWARGLHAFVSDPMIFALGGGFRSSGSDQIGFSTESSYITILLDNGIFIGGMIILLFWSAPLRGLLMNPARARHTSPLLFFSSFMTFAIVESTFNRYLLAVGNPASLMTLLLLMSFSFAAASAWETAPAQPENWYLAGVNATKREQT